MQTLTDLNKKLLEVQQIHSQLDKKKAALIDTKRELDKHLKELLQKQSELDKLMAQTRQKEMQLRNQIQEVLSQMPEPEVDYLSGTASKKLQNELLALLSGNGRVATRLLKHQQRLNPGRTLDWYLEKVIYDLKRDRHC